MYSQYQYTMNNTCANLFALVTCESTAQRSFSLRLNSMVFKRVYHCIFLRFDIIFCYFSMQQCICQKQLIIIFLRTRNAGYNTLVPSFFCGQRCQKSYHRDNWLVAAERSKRCRFLILRCRLFLSCARIRAQG